MRVIFLKELISRYRLYRSHHFSEVYSTVPVYKELNEPNDIHYVLCSVILIPELKATNISHYGIKRIDSMPFNEFIIRVTNYELSLTEFDEITLIADSIFNLRYFKCI